MKLERTQLLKALNTVKPALASKDLIAELCHVWSDGKTFMAYNDAELGIQVPFKSELQGGIRGSTFLGLVHNSRAREISLEPGKEEGSIILKAARTHATLSILPVERSVWKFPAKGAGTAFRLSAAFLEALGAVLISIGKDTTHPEAFGVTLYIDEGVFLFATDTNTISVADLKETLKDDKGKVITKKFEHIILPAAFCEQILKLDAETAFMELRDDCALAGDGTGILIYARLHHTSRPLDLWSIIEQFTKFPKDAKFEVPERLSLALDRMGVLFDGLHGEAMEVKIAEGRMNLYAKIEGRGELKDSADVPNEVPAISFKTDPALIKRALPLVTHMVCSDAGIRMSNAKGFLYLAAHTAV